MIKIIEVNTKAELKKFVRFPTWLLKGNKFYAPPMDLDEFKMFSPKNPSWEQVELKAFLAIDDEPNKTTGFKFGKNKVVGRIAVIIQKVYNEKHGVNYARFTRFDFIDNKAVAHALLDAGCAWARVQGMEVVHGPLGFNDLDREGLLIEGFDKMNTFAESYNYAYYKTYIEDYGFEKEVDWLEFVIKVPEKLDERVAKISNKMMERLKLHVLPPKMSLKQLLKLYDKQIFDLINSCYADLHGVIPITDKVRDDLLKQFKQIVRREHICLVFNEKDEIVGFGLTAPNISRSLNKSRGRYCNFGFIPFNALRIMREARKPRYVDFGLIAIAPEYRGKGVNAMLMNELFGNLIENKIISVETNLQLENNAAILNMFDGYDQELVKKRRCFAYHLPKV